MSCTQSTSPWNWVDVVCLVDIPLNSGGCRLVDYSVYILLKSGCHVVCSVYIPLSSAQATYFLENGCRLLRRHSFEKWMSTCRLLSLQFLVEWMSSDQSTSPWNNSCCLLSAQSKFPENGCCLLISQHSLETWMTCRLLSLHFLVQWMSSAQSTPRKYRDRGTILKVEGQKFLRM